MKTILKIFTCIFLTLLVMYLIVSISVGSFNFETWSEDVRGGFGVLGFYAAIVGVMAGLILE